MRFAEAEDDDGAETEGGHTSDGGDDEVTIRRNNDAYREYEFHFDVLAGLSPPLDLSTKIFGKDVKLPFFA